MPNPNALYEDMEKLNALYEELCWAHDDELVFTHDGKEVIIYNKTKENQNVQWKRRKTEWPCSNDRFRCSSRILLHYWSGYSWIVVMLLLATMMLGMWIFISALGSNDADDDDDFGGGMMIPAYNPTS